MTNIILAAALATSMYTNAPYVTNAQTNRYSSSSSIAGTIEWNTITIGPVTICCTNGVVTIKDGVTMDDASREFWQTLERVYPESFKGMTK